MLPKLTGLCVSAMILAAASQAAGEEPGFAWTTNSDGGKAYLVYGSTETGEDYLYSLGCDGKRKSSDMTVYVDIAGTKVGDPVAIAFGPGKLSVPGRIATDEMSGFHFAETAGFNIKPLIAVLREKGPVMVKTGDVVTTLPEAGRGKAVGKFAKSCALD